MWVSSTPSQWELSREIPTTDFLNPPAIDLSSTTQIIDFNIGSGLANVYTNANFITSETYDDLNSIDPAGYLIATKWSSGTIGFNGTTDYGQIDYAEIIVYNTVLTDTNRKRVESYLSDKYSIAII